MIKELSELSEIIEREEDGRHARLNGRSPYSEDDLRSAGRNLLYRQFLYASRARDAASIRIIQEYDGYFARLMDAFGYDLISEPSVGMLGILPQDNVPSADRWRLIETLLLLCLRTIYQRNILEINVEGVSVTDSTELHAVYTDLIRRKDIDNIGDLERELKGLKRRGVVDIARIDEKMFGIEIKPAIRYLCGDQWIARLKTFLDEEASASRWVAGLLPMDESNPLDEINKEEIGETAGSEDDDDV